MALGLSLATLAIAGCGGSSAGSAARASAIAIVSSSGAAEKVSVVAVASSLNLRMTPTGDTLHAGVDWTITCGGNPVTGSVVNGGCGTLAPAHTADGATTVYTAPSQVPIGATIDLTATVTGNPSQTSSMSLTVLALPIAVAISANNGIPSRLGINAQTTLLDSVTNDPLDAGVIWTATCGSSACGSFNPASGTTGSTVYTAPAAAPAGGTVTIAATSLTDTTKSSSTSIMIGPPPGAGAIAVSVSPALVYAQTVGAAHTAQLTAFVVNDAAQSGVDWTVSCGSPSCGAITTHTASGAPATYSAPSAIPAGGTVAIKASSTADPAAASTATATIVTAAPIVVTLFGPPATLTTGSQATLAATVASDPNNLGVTWTAACGSPGVCGSFNLSPAQTASGAPITYTAPAAVPAGGGLVTITASSPASTPANPGVGFTFIVAQPPAVAITLQPPATLVAASHAAVSATVANDVAPGGVTWSVTCNNTAVPGSCGWIAPLQTASGGTAIYTAPPAQTSGTTVTITAAATATVGANPISAPGSSSSITANPIDITPNTTPTVSFLPMLPSQVPASATVNLAAAVAHDTTNAGVDWQVCASGCGFFTLRPAIAAVPATPTMPYIPAVPAVTATSVPGWSNGLPIAYTAPAQQPSSGPVAVLAAAHADPNQSIGGEIAITSSATGPALNGVVQAGSQAVVGSSVALYAAGASGYASAATQIASATSGKGGSFTVAAGYSCPSPASQMYLVATGGAAGSSPANPNLALMTVLGSCGSLGSAPMVVNEVTSVASAFATAPFSSNDALTGNKSYLYIGASSGNQSGLANAFAAFNNLVTLATGQANFVTAAGNASVPYVEINTLADALYACTSTGGGVEGDGSACSTLFTATDVLLPGGGHELYHAIGPSDTLQAIFNVAERPVTNYGYTLDPLQNLLALAAPGSPFEPILTAYPNDWSISLNYTGGGGLTPASTVGSMAVDAGGDLWITDTAFGTAIEWNAAGAAVSPATGFPAGGGPVAIDASGNVWIAGDGLLTELTSLGTPAPGSPFAGVTGGSDIAIDAQGNLWIAGGTGVHEFSSLGVRISPAAGFTFSNLSAIGAVGVDSADDIWIGNQENSAQGNAFFAELTNPGAQFIVDGPGSNGAVLPEIAADSGGDLWGIVGVSGEVCEVKPYAGSGSTLLPTCYTPDTNTGGGLLTENPAGVALDGAGTVWVASQGGGNGPVILPSVLPIAPSLLAANFPNYLVAPSLAAGALRVAIDGSGNVWVLLANNTVTEFLGVAAPVTAPIALGVKNNKLASRP